MDRPERPAVGKKRGISIVATEDRLAKLPFRQATLFSTALHILGPVALTVLTLLVLLILSWIMHFNFWDLFTPKAPPHDMEFSLVNDTHATRPDKPIFKGNFNQRAGGKQNKTEPLKALEEPPHASAASKPKAAPTETKAPEQAKQPKPEQAAQQQPAPAPKQPAKPDTKQATKPDWMPTIPKPAKQEAPKPTLDGPVAKTQTNASAGSPGANPQIASIGNTMAGTGSSASSATGNPQDGDATNPGVDVVQDVDFGPFMADLERRIKRNWTPPRGAESRKVLLLFYLARDGQIVKIETKKSSGDEDADRAAIAAVQASAPFQAFPPQVKEDILPVEFTFDYNVLNPKNPKQALKW
jgi:TonB family protein